MSDERVPIDFEADRGNPAVWARLAGMVTADLAARVGGLAEATSPGAEASLERAGRMWWVAMRSDGEPRALVTAEGDEAVLLAPIGGEYTVKIAQLVFERLVEVFRPWPEEAPIIVDAYEMMMPPGEVKVLRARADVLSLRAGHEPAPQRAIDDWHEPRVEGGDAVVFQVNTFGPGQHLEVRVTPGVVAHRLLGQGQQAVRSRPAR
jgi:hypothetical protein